MVSLFKKKLKNRLHVFGLFRAFGNYVNNCYKRQTTYQKTVDKKERKVLKKIFTWPCLHQLYRPSEKISDYSRKWRLIFYGYVLNTNNDRVTKRTLISVLKVKDNSLYEFERDLLEISITESTTNDRFITQKFP